MNIVLVRNNSGSELLRELAQPHEPNRNEHRSNLVFQINSAAMSEFGDDFASLSSLPDEVRELLDAPPLHQAFTASEAGLATSQTPTPSPQPLSSSESSTPPSDANVSLGKYASAYVL